MHISVSLVIVVVSIIHRPRDGLTQHVTVPGVQLAKAIWGPSSTKMNRIPIIQTTLSHHLDEPIASVILNSILCLLTLLPA